MPVCARDRLLVSWTFVIDTFHTGALCWMIWYIVVDNFTNPSTFFNAPWPLTATPTFVAMYVCPRSSLNRCDSHPHQNFGTH